MHQVLHQRQKGHGIRAWQLGICSHSFGPLQHCLVRLSNSADVSGPVTFMIDGFVGAVQGESPSDTALFIGYKLQINLPKQRSEQNIDIPESAGVTAKAGYGAVP